MNRLLIIILIIFFIPISSATDGDEIFSITITGADMDMNTASIGESGTIYIYPDGTSKLYAFYPNGTEKWNTEVGLGALQSDPVVGPGEMIYILNDATDEVKAVYPNGTIKYSYDTGGAKYGGIAVGSDSHVYSIDGWWIIALDENGDEIWNAEPTSGGELYTSPCVSDVNDMIYISSWLGGITGLSTANGAEIWTHPWTEDSNYNYIYNTPALSLDESTVYFVKGDGADIGMLYAFDAFSGDLEWVYNTGDAVYARSSPTVLRNGDIVFGGGGSLNTNPLYCITPSGSLRWRTLTPGDWGVVEGNVVELEDYSLVFSHIGDLYSINADTGAMLKIFDTVGEDNRYASVSVASSGDLYFAVNGSTFYGVEGSTAAMYNYADYIAGDVPNNFHIWRNQYEYPVPEPTPTPDAVLIPVVALPPMLPVQESTPGVDIEPPTTTIIEEILILISSNWLFILFAYLGATIGKLLSGVDEQGIKEVLVIIAFAGTVGWVIPVVLTFIGLINLIFDEFFINVVIFFSFGFIVYSLMNIFQKHEDSIPQR